MEYLKFGRVAKLADAPDLGSGLARDGGSSPLPPMIAFGDMIKLTVNC